MGILAHCLSFGPRRANTHGAVCERRSGGRYLRIGLFGQAINGSGVSDIVGEILYNAPYAKPCRLSMMRVRPVRGRLMGMRCI